MDLGGREGSQEWEARTILCQPPEKHGLEWDQGNRFWKEAVGILQQPSQA